MSVLLSSPKLKSRNLFEEGFKCLSEKEQEKWVNRALCDNQMTEWKKDALMSTWVFPISKKEDLNLLPQLKQAEKIKIVFGELTTDDAMTVLSKLQNGNLSALFFENFPKEEVEQEPLIKILAPFKKAGCYISLCGDLMKKIEAEVKRAEAAKRAGQEEWKIDFYQKLAVKNYHGALAVLKERGLFEQKQEISKAEFGREFDLSPLGWGQNSLEVKNSLVGVDIKDLGNNQIAIGQIYEDRSWRSTVDYNSGIGWYWKGEVAVVDLERGVGPVAQTNTLCVRDPHDVSGDIFGNIPREDFLSVEEGDRVYVRLGWYACASVKIPEVKPVVISKKKTNQKSGKHENTHE